jgi:uncharacterized spore protein YtfJ
MSMSDAERAVQRQMSGPAGRILEGIADRLGGKATAAAVYGEPVERDGVTVIPVAKVRWGFGGGGGSGAGGSGKVGDGFGEGGGGGVIASPVGYIEIKNGETAFQRIKDPTAVLLAVPPIILAGSAALWVLLRGLRRVIRG